MITADEDLSEKGKEKAEVASEGGETKSGETKSSAATDEISADATKDKKEDDIKLEITNPDDIQIDDKGQMEMF
ncbi:hypothetical protein D3C81_2046160 [compost metagenome]